MIIQIIWYNHTFDYLNAKSKKDSKDRQTRLYIVVMKSNSLETTPT